MTDMQLYEHERCWFKFQLTSAVGVGQVCSLLLQAADQALLDQELKRCLGYKGTPGHRSWAKVRRKMVDLELLHVFVGVLDGKPVTVCKLLKPWHGHPPTSRVWQDPLADLLSFGLTSS